MSAFFEIAFAAASERLCIFTGTGFSKAITEDAAPSWQGLLEMVCDELHNPELTKNVLFPPKDVNPLSLEESAQVIAIELANKGKDIHTEIAKKVRAISLSGDNSVITDFFQENSLTIVTTNYDKLAEELVGAEHCLSISPGFPVPRSRARVIVYHVHGAVDSPQNMVVTSDDYHRFINEQSYFSRKMSTILHENTVVILGYSLADTNLKAILSDYKNFSRNHVIGGNLFFVSKSKVHQYVKDYYAYCYGIRVLDRHDVHQFFEKVNFSMPEARKCADSSKTIINSVLFDNKSYTDEYLKMETSFFEIISSVAAIGRSIDDALVVGMLENILNRKIELTGVAGAWEQYEHLARWLIYLGSILELAGTSIRETYLSAVLRSMKTMSSSRYYGYSWHAYTSWSNGWSKIIASNRAIIKAYIEDKTDWPDALEVVGRQ
jgi:hypothetical protein